MQDPNSVSSPYAVIDVETTGLSPAYHHRVVEIAIVLVDAAGRVMDEWETLVNPERDVGAAEIHGLSGADVYGAPTFNQIAGELVSLLSGRVPVAHNLAFDANFLASEFQRLGLDCPLEDGLCTMELAGCYLQSPPRALEACCGCIGWHLGSAHCALEDARAAAHLLAHFIHADGAFEESWKTIIGPARCTCWPALGPSGVPRVARRRAAAATRQHFLGRLASRAPRSEVHPEANGYLALLDRVLLDRQLSCHEEDELISVAGMMGLAREDAMGLHRDYLRALGRLALEDGVVTREERADLECVAGILGLSATDVNGALSQQAGDEERSCRIGSFALSPGDAVVFTGEAPDLDRAELECQARTLGLRVTGGVSKKTKLVVAADPDSISGKARKARELGIPIVDYATYLGILDSGALKSDA